MVFITVALSVCLFVCNNSTVAEETRIKFGFAEFLSKLFVRRFKSQSDGGEQLQCLGWRLQRSWLCGYKRGKCQEQKL
jgi:hypothetical protein